MGPSASRTATALNKTALEKLDQLAEYFTEKISEQSLNFLYLVGIKNPTALDKLLIKLKRNTLQLKIKITADHVDTAIQLLYKQMALPASILASIDKYLETKEILTLEKITRFLHSDVDSNRSLLAIEQALHVISSLNLLTTEIPKNNFLKALISAIIAYNKKDHNNPEKTLAWLNQALQIPPNSPLALLLDFLIDRIITLGSTLIESPVRTMGLSELFFIFEELAVQANLPVTHESNARLLADINAIMIAMNVCIKNPIAFYDVVNLQQNSKIALLMNLKRYVQEPLILERFFSTPEFHHYFGKRDAEENNNKEAFLMALAPCVTAHAQQNPNFSAFLNTCKKQLPLMLHDKKFSQWFMRECQQKNTVHLDSLFFVQIANEESLRSTQIGSLVFAANKLVSMGFSPRSASTATSGSFQPLIRPDVPMTTSKNLKSLSAFYNGLDASHQQKLIRELILLAVIVEQNNHLFTRPAQTNHDKIKQDSHQPLSKKANQPLRYKNDRFFPTITIHAAQNAISKKMVKSKEALVLKRTLYRPLTH